MYVHALVEAIPITHCWNCTLSQISMTGKCALRVACFVGILHALKCRATCLLRQQTRTCSRAYSSFLKMTPTAFNLLLCLEKCGFRAHPHSGVGSWILIRFPLHAIQARTYQTRLCSLVCRVWFFPATCTSAAEGSESSNWRGMMLLLWAPPLPDCSSPRPQPCLL